MTIATLRISIARGSPYDQSYDLYAKSGGWPIEAGDGIYVGNFPIKPWLQTVQATWTPPATGSWFVSAVALNGIGPTVSPLAPLASFP